MSHLAASHVPSMQQLCVIRPFLGFPKSELLAYCLANGVRWVEDPSNRDIEYARVRYRMLLAGVHSPAICVITCPSP
jgi:tRNA(Ile)-lysidine synthase TilS/MesJ